MRKELAAAALLLAIFAVSAYSGRHLEGLLRQLDSGADAALAAAEAGRWSEVRAESDAITQLWSNAGRYARVFLRQPEIDAVSETLISLQDAATGQDYPACLSAVYNLRTRLGSIRDTERLSLGSVF